MYLSKNVSLFELAEGKDSKERDLHSLLTGDDGLPSNFLEWSVLTVCFQIERKLL